MSFGDDTLDPSCQTIHKRRIDEKHHIEVKDGAIQIVKTTNGQPILEDEPIILFRGRDKLALPMLIYYAELCCKDGATAYQLESMNKMISAFSKFRDSQPDKMKQPGCTLGK